MLSVLKANFKINLILFSLVLVWISPGFSAVLGRGIVQSPMLNLRKAPSPGAGVASVLKRGTRVDVLAREGGIGGWLTLAYKGDQGYVRNRPQYIKLVNFESQKPGPESRIKRRLRKTTPGKTAKKKEVIQTKIVQEETLAAGFSREEMEMVEGLDRIDRSLNRARLNRDRLSREIKSIEKQMQDGKHRLTQLSGQLDENREYAGDRLSALYKMSMIGRLNLATAGAGTLFDLFVKQNAMKQVVRADLQTLDQQIRNLAALKQIQDRLAIQAAQKAAKQKDLSGQIHLTEKETQRRRAVLKKIRRKKNLSLAALASLKASARALDEKMADFGSRLPASGPRASFLNQKGRLPIPVKGKVVSRYGPARIGDYNAFTFQTGIDIRVDRGEPVRSVFKGEVLYAEWLKGYGNLLIINHGNDYCTLYAHVEEMFKKRGELVDTDEVIATAGDTGSIKGLFLHFEIRHHGKPVDPDIWLRKGA